MYFKDRNDTNIDSEFDDGNLFSKIVQFVYKYKDYFIIGFIVLIILVVGIIMIIDNNVTTIYMRGGKVTIADVMKTLDQDSIKKMEFDTLTKEELETKYISYESDYDYKLANGQEYALLVNKNSNNIYTIIANGYGIFKENSSSKTKSSKRAFINVLTQKELTDKNGKTLLFHF